MQNQFLTAIPLLFQNYLVPQNSSILFKIQIKLLSPIRKIRPKRAAAALVSPGQDNVPPDVPSPQNGSRFKKKEAVEAFASYKHKEKKSDLIDDWHTVGWIPVKHSISYWYRLVKKLEEKNHTWRDWDSDGNTKIGRPAYAEKEDIEQMAITNRSKKHNCTDGIEDIENMIQSVQKRQKTEQGLYFNPTVIEPCNRTLKRYKTVATTLVPVTITDRAISKTEARITAETSVHSTASFMVTSAMTMLMIGRPHSGISKIKDASVGAQKLYNLVSKYHGGVAITPRPNHLIYSTDDTTIA